MTYPEVLTQAREKLAPVCLVCPQCNGVACRGKIPGPGAKGTASSFIRNFDQLARIKLNMDMIYEDTGRDCSVSLFGHTFAGPVFTAPIGSMRNYTPALSDDEFLTAMIGGAKEAGIVAFTGDGVGNLFDTSLSYIKQFGGHGIATLKPWDLQTVEQKIRAVEESGAMAIAMDIDAAGLVHMPTSYRPSGAKSVADLKEIVSMTKLPFLVKGIMTPGAAHKAQEAGAYGIIVSNHGGRVLDHTLATCEVLPGIKAAVGDGLKVLVDGGVRTGVDIFKMLALGADAVLIGRPYVIAAFGGGAEGVACYTQTLLSGLKDAMLMTGCATLQDITKNHITITD